MGQVRTKAILINNRDITRLEDQTISVDRVRQSEQEMIVDTGARAIGLPLSVIEQLGLPKTREVLVTLSDGSKQRRQMYGELRVQIGDRDSVFDCIAKPEGAPLLLGQLVLETLDLVVDCGRQQLIPNPEAPDGLMLYEDY
jgi:predicted aspartyl protease